MKRRLVPFDAWSRSADELIWRAARLMASPSALSSLRGKPVVLHYWATWCEPCKQDMKLLRRLQASYQKAGLQLVGVNVDVTQDLADGYLKNVPLPWVQLFEEGGLESSGLAKAFGVQTLPTMMLIDKDGQSGSPQRASR